MAEKNKIVPVVEAINIVGRALFAPDWIGEMLFGEKAPIFPSISQEEKLIIDEFGPRPGTRGGVTAKPCTSQAKLERALGRWHMIPAQRGAAADWLVERGLLASAGCDRDEIVALLGARPKDVAARKKGGRRRKFEAISLLMIEDIATSRRTRSWLADADGKNLAHAYNADPKTCKKARDLALLSFS
jgi:hypothetical protein